jgi:FkbM family methyltransferase
MVAESLKRKLAASQLGPWLIRLRHIAGILSQTLSNNAESGTTGIQDYISEILLARLPAPGTTFVDVGAHLGSIVGQVQRSQRDVAIVAIEAVPEKAESLKRQFPAAVIHHCAAGDEDRETAFFVDDERSAHSSLSQRAGREVVVPMRRLDTLLEGANAIDIVKLDVEGAELQVLRGAAETVESHRPICAFESVNDWAEIFDWFAEREYQLFVPNRVAHDGPPLSREGFDEAHYHPRRTTDYFAIPAERRTEVRDRARQVLGVRA